MAALLTTRQVQDLLQVDRTTIYRMVEGGRLPALRVGKQWRFRAEDIERWLAGQGAPAPERPGAVPAAEPCLAELLPLACGQLIQEAFADILGSLMVITDLEGRPVTRVSNPGGLVATLLADEEGRRALVASWRALAASPDLWPRWEPGAMGLLFTRGLIRLRHELVGAVILGGLAPVGWRAPDGWAGPRDAHRLGDEASARVLGSAQRIADIYAHIAEDRSALCGRLAAIASLTSLQPVPPLEGANR